MKYFKNTELAKLYHVSEKSVRNWIQAAQAGKLDLELHEENGRSYIANTSENTRNIEQLAEKGKKYKNSRGYSGVTPTKDFYKLYSKKQILDIVSNITIHREIPTQYTYVDGAAKYWDQFANRLKNEQAANILNKTVELLDIVSPTIDHYLDGYQKVNVIDLGPGNGLPVRSTLAHMVERGTLNRYIAIDGSKKMLDILQNNIKEWFGDAVKFEGYVRDFCSERFDDLLVDDYFDENANTTANVVFLLGGTLSNFRSPDKALQTINDSMGVNDLLIYSGYLDTPSTRRFFDYTSRPSQKFRSELILNLLGIDESDYAIEQHFHEGKQARHLNCIPQKDVTIKFELANGARYAELRKGEPILLWRHWHFTPLRLIGLIDKNNFDLLQATKTPDQNYVLLISKIKTGIE